MSNQSTEQLEHDDILALLPWYVNNTLEDRERDLVKNHIDHCEACKQEVLFLTSLGQTVQSQASDSYAMNANVDRDLSAVMNLIDADEQSSPQENHPLVSANRWQIKCLNFISSLTVPQWGVTALAGLLVAVVSFNLLISQPQDDYSVLSSSDINDTSMHLSVQLAPSANHEQMRTLIQDLIPQFEQPLKMEVLSNNSYVIMLEDKLSVTELDELTKKLVRLDGIERAELMPWNQLPKSER